MKRKNLPTQESRWLSGRKVWEWLDQRVDMRDVQMYHPLAMDTIRKWRNGSTAEIYTVDRVLTKLGLHISELPDDIGCDAPQARKSRYYSRELKREAVKRYAKGEMVTKIADDMNISASVIYSWRRQAGEVPVHKRAMNQKREEAIKLFKQGLTAREVSKRLDVGYTTITDWRRVWRKGGGVDAMRQKRGPNYKTAK